MILNEALSLNGYQKIKQVPSDHTRFISNDSRKVAGYKPINT